MKTTMVVVVTNQSEKSLPGISLGDDRFQYFERRKRVNGELINGEEAYELEKWE